MVRMARADGPKDAEQVSIASLETAFGPLWLAASERGLCRLVLPAAKEHTRFHEWTKRYDVSEQHGSAVIVQAKTELNEYLAGTRRQFTVPLDLEGSGFFRQVWNALLSIPYGSTVTYTTLATQVRRPRAYRAVGAACARNPTPLIVPCHRAVGRNGSLTGFAGGLAMKEALLKLEGTRNEGEDD